MLQSAADFSITMLAGGKHTAIKEGAAPYNYDLKVLYKSELDLQQQKSAAPKIEAAEYF